MTDPTKSQIFSSKSRRRRFGCTRIAASAPICHTNHSFLYHFGYVASYKTGVSKRRKSRRRWNRNDDDGIAIRCRRRRLLPPSFTWSPSSCWFTWWVYIPSKSLSGHFDLSLTFTFRLFAYYFSLIIFLNRFSATKYITLNMYVYITGLW